MINKSNKQQQSSNLHPHDNKLTLNRSSSNISNNATTSLFTTGNTNITNTNKQGGGGTININDDVNVNANVEDVSDRMKDRKGGE